MAIIKQLTKNQKVFCDEYMIDHNATRAYMAAYVKVTKNNVAAVSASNLLRNPNIQQYINEKFANIGKKYEITIERVLKESARIAFFNPKELFNDDGSPKEISQLSDDVAAALVGLEVVENYEGFGEDRMFVGYTKKYKLADKKGMLDSLMRHLGMFNDKVEHSGSVDSNITIKIGGEDFGD